jgi:putative sterol carrier protein
MGSMPYFSDADELYGLIGTLLQELAADADLAEKFATANTVIQWRYTDPDAQITARLRPGEETRVDLGDTDLRPEVVMTMDADTAHRFWLGELSVTVALARGQMHAKGPVAKVLKLVPLLKPAFGRYRERVGADA